MRLLDLSSPLRSRIAVIALLALCACSRDVATGRRCTQATQPCGQAPRPSRAGSAGISGTDGPDTTHTGDAVEAPDSALRVRIDDFEGMTIEVVTIACEGECVEVEAVAHGGHAPYAFTWEDGSTSTTRRLCPGPTSIFTVSATDTAVHADEFGYEAHTVTASVTSRVLDCSDAGVCETGPGPETPASGHYEGTGSYVCDNDMDPALAMVINQTAVIFDLDIDEDRQDQHGHLFFQWGLVVIAGEGELTGSLECNGELIGPVTGTWGLPGIEPRTVLPTGTITGELTASQTDQAGKVTGTWFWISTLPTGERGNECHGRYEALLVPE